MGQDNPLYTAIQQGVVYIAAKVNGDNVPNWPVVKARPTDWIFGHPAGAMLNLDIEVDMSGLVDDVAINRFSLRDEKKRPLGEFEAMTPLRLEAQCVNRISRAIVVPRAPASSAV